MNGHAARVMRVTTFPRGLIHQFARGIYALPTLAAFLGIGLALVARWMDGLVPGGGTPVPHARALLAGVAGATITATAVLFWVRGMLVQLTSASFSSRILRWYLEDRFERGALAFLVGAFAFLALAIVTLPASEAARAGRATTALAFLVALGVLFVIIASIANSVRVTRVSRILAGVTDRTLDAIRRLHPPAGEVARAGMGDAPDAPPHARAVHATRHGWVRDMDANALLDALPAGTTAWLDVRVGSFVTEGTRIARVHADPEDDAERVTSAVRDALHIADERALEHDVAVGVLELVDVALRALAPGTADTSTAFETTRYLGVVTREILLRDLPPRVLRTADGARVVRTRDLTHAEYVAHAFRQIRHTGARWPVVSEVLLDTFGMLVSAAEAAGVPERAAAVREEAAHVLAAAERADLIDADRDALTRVARAHGFA